MLKLPKKKKWYGTRPSVCDVCGGTIGSVFYDAPISKTWYLMCHACYIGYRPPIGQKYKTDSLLKVADIKPKIKR